MSTVDEELEALRREVRELRAIVADLRAQPRTPTMRGDGRCPACAGRKLLYAHEVRAADGTTGAEMPMALEKASVWTGERRGKFECVVCATCGLVEWYVPSIEGIKIDGQRFELVDATDPAAPNRGPYR